MLLGTKCKKHLCNVCQITIKQEGSIHCHWVIFITQYPQESSCSKYIDVSIVPSHCACQVYTDQACLWETAVGTVLSPTASPAGRMPCGQLCLAPSDAVEFKPLLATPGVCEGLWLCWFIVFTWLGKLIMIMRVGFVKCNPPGPSHLHTYEIGVYSYMSTNHISSIVDRETNIPVDYKSVGVTSPPYHKNMNILCK